MACRLNRRVRTALVAVVAAGAAALAPTVAAHASPHATPAHPRPEPTISSVQRELGLLAVRNDQLVERYNQATEAYRAARESAARAATAARVAAARLAEANRQLSASAVAQYEGGSYSTTGALLSSPSGASYLDQLDTLSMLSSHNAQIVSSYAATQRQAAAATHAAARAFADATAKRSAVRAERSATVKQIAKYKTLLARLNAEQRALLARQQRQQRATPAQVTAARTVQVASGGVRRAIDFALAQVGKPYVFGAAGPSSYDCSGLTMAAYAAAGISLPHSAADQYNYGQHVGYSQLRPGDLMFFYSPIGHVTIYIGGGMMVSAPQTGENVQVVPAAQFRSDFVGATRLIG